MSNQANPSVTNPSIANTYEKMVDKKLILQPDFQRKFVWTQDHQEDFIDTILQGYPFPEIYICQGEFDKVNLKTSEEVIDGQQRLTTIKNYIEGKFSKPLKKIPNFKNLTDIQVKDFMQYKVVVRDIGEVGPEIVREIFRRINLTKFKLEDVEIQNAVYDGPFISTAKDIASNITLKDYGVFRESEFTRMADVHFILLIMATIEQGGYFNRDSEVENSIALYNDEYPNSEKISNDIFSTFDAIEKLGLLKDSIWFRKSNFFTMAIELFLVQELPQNLKDKLDFLHDKILENKLKPENEFGNYYSYMYQGTNSRKARITRGNLFRKHILT